MITPARREREKEKEKVEDLKKKTTCRRFKTY